MAARLRGSMDGCGFCRGAQRKRSAERQISDRRRRGEASGGGSARHAQGQSNIQAQRSGHGSGGGAARVKEWRFLCALGMREIAPVHESIGVRGRCGIHKCFS